MDTLFLASGNTHKIEELNQLLSDMGIELKSTLDFPDAEEVVEDQPNLEGNAMKKARYWYGKTGLPSLADDTGLEVNALDGSPGVYSARYAGEDASDKQNVDKLLNELKNEVDRSARFKTVIAFIDESGNEHFFEGVCRGKILKKRRGEKGFGYDPVFLPDGYDQTFAELSGSEKNKISHRGLAMRSFIDYLQNG